MAIKEYLITHGTIRLKGHFGTGEVVELEESEAKLMDPDGTCLKLKSLHDAEQVGEAAKQVALKKAEAAYAKALAEELAKKPLSKSAQKAAEAEAQRQKEADEWAALEAEEKEKQAKAQKEGGK